MKTVFTNDMVAHVWVQQTQQHGRSHNGNLWFEGDTLYSYHTPIARIVRTKHNALLACLVTERGYSHTTGGHKRKLQWAWGSKGAHAGLFSVPSLGRPGGRNQNDFPEIDHEANLTALIANYDRERDSLMRVNSAWWLGIADGWESAALPDLKRVAENAARYAEHFGLVVPVFDPLGDTAAAKALWEKREALRNTPEARAKRERERERRAARKAEREARQATERAERETEAREAWLRGEKRYWRGVDRHGAALLRVRFRDSNSYDVVETSLGAEVPLAEAVKVFRFVKLVRDRGAGWRANGYCVPVGNFTVDRIEPSGNFKAGCHIIRWEEATRIAREVGAFDLDPSAEACRSRAEGDDDV